MNSPLINQQNKIVHIARVSPTYQSAAENEHQTICWKHRRRAAHRTLS